MNHNSSNVDFVCFKPVNVQLNLTIYDPRGQVFYNYLILNGIAY